MHERTAIYEMCLFYKQIYQVTQQHLLLHRQESESLYTNYYPSYLLLSPYRHWRTMSHATHAFMTHSAGVKKYWHYFENTKHVGDLNKRHLGSESRTTNKIFEHLPGFCPIPALAGHLQSENTLPPVFDWRRLWDENSSLAPNTSDVQAIPIAPEAVSCKPHLDLALARFLNHKSSKEPDYSFAFTQSSSSYCSQAKT